MLCCKPRCMSLYILWAAGRQLLQNSNVPGAYVQAQIAILTSGNMATSLQVQLKAAVVNPQSLLLNLQQHGLAVTEIALQSLDVEQVSTAAYNASYGAAETLECYMHPSLPMYCSSAGPCVMHIMHANAVHFVVRSALLFTRHQAELLTIQSVQKHLLKIS